MATSSSPDRFSHLTDQKVSFFLADWLTERKTFAVNWKFQKINVSLSLASNNMEKWSMLNLKDLITKRQQQMKKKKKTSGTRREKTFTSTTKCLFILANERTTRQTTQHTRFSRSAILIVLPSSWRHFSFSLSPLASYILRRLERCHVWFSLSLTFFSTSTCLVLNQPSSPHSHTFSSRLCSRHDSHLFSICISNDERMNANDDDDDDKDEKQWTRRSNQFRRIWFELITTICFENRKSKVISTS